MKTRVALVAQMRFCAINKLGKDFIGFHLVLTESCVTSVFYKTEQFGRFFVHHYRLYREQELTPELMEYLRQAYQVSNRRI